MEVREARVSYSGLSESPDNLVPFGYKQTEVGVIPEAWDVQSLLDIADFSNGKPHEGDVNDEGCYQLITLDSVGIDGRLKLEHKRTNTWDSSLMKNDIVSVLSDLAHGDLLGLCDVVPADSTYVLNQRMGRLRMKVAGAPQFVRLQINRHQDHFKRRGQGTSQKHIYRRDFDSLLIPFPEPAEQEFIAEALSDADALIESLEQLIAKKRQIKQGTMQALLAGEQCPRTSHGECEVKRLGEICEIAIGRTPPRLNQAMWGRGFLWLSIADLQAKVVSRSKEQVTMLAASTMKIIPKGTLLMSFKLSIGRLCFAGCDLFTNEAICSFNKLQANPEFLYYALGRTDFSLYGKQAVKGYTLNKESLKMVEVRLPPRDEQTAIATVLTDMDTELAELETRLAKTRQLKQGMMQELLTGRIRLV